MKQIFTLVAATLLLSSFVFFSGMDEVVNGIRTGNAAMISKNFDNTVEITISDKGNTYSKSQAEMVLKDFFTSNPVKSFEIVHKGENGGSQYCIGNLSTRGSTFRTTVYMKQKGDKQLLQEIRFE